MKNTEYEKRICNSHKPITNQRYFISAVLAMQGISMMNTGPQGCIHIQASILIA